MRRRAPRTRVERFAQPRESDMWELEEAEEPLTLGPPVGTAYVDLPVR